MELPWNRHKLDSQGATEPSSALISRRASLVKGAFGLAATLALAGCAVSEVDSLETVALETHGDTGGAAGRSAPVVAGETLDAELLNRFYARRGHKPVWARYPAHANALKATVLRARQHGLDPEMFHAGLLRRMDMFPPDRRELLLSHAVLTYAEALAFGAVPPSRRREAEALAPEPVDVAEVLDEALDRPDPVAAIEALAPNTPTYRALRRALQQQVQHTQPGHASRSQIGRLRVIEANLERQRWLPRALPQNRVWVNVPDQQLVFYRDNRPVFITRVVVGEETARKQSPEFNTVIESALFNPPWVIPPDIVEADIRPMLKRDPQYLVRNKIVLLPNGEAEQAPGPEAGLGVVMFEMPNRFDVYLHDTPDKEVFSRHNRRISNGCIRVQNPLELAALLMEEPIDVIQRKVATGGTVRRPMPNPVPVFLLYQTAFASAGQELEIRPDFYGRDEALWQRLQKRSPQQGEAGSEQVAAGNTRTVPGPQTPRRSIQPPPRLPITERNT